MPGGGRSPRPGTARESASGFSVVFSAGFVPSWPGTSLPISAVAGRLLADLAFTNKPWAFGAEATRRSFLANSSLRAAFVCSAASRSTVTVMALGVSGGDGGTLLSL